MENHGDPRDREGESGAEHEEYEFLQETLKDEKKRGRIGKSTIIKCAALGLVFGMAVRALRFFALKPVGRRSACLRRRPDESVYSGRSGGRWKGMESRMLRRTEST